MAITGTYSGDPKTSTRDLVRFLIGDTDTSDWLLDDREIDYQLESIPPPYLAAAACCEAIAARFSRDVTKSMGGLSVSASERVTHYTELAAALRKQHRRKVLIVPYVGGLSQSDKVSSLDDSDAVQPNFRIGMDDLPSSSKYRGGGG